MDARWRRSGFVRDEGGDGGGRAFVDETAAGLAGGVWAEAGTVKAEILNAAGLIATTRELAMPHTCIAGGKVELLPILGFSCEVLLVG